MPLSNTERVRKWRAENPEKAKKIYMAQQRKDGDKIRERARAWSIQNPQRRKEIKADYDNRRNSDIDVWARHMVSSIKSRCKKRGALFNLTKNDLLEAFPKDFICPAIGVPIKFGSGKLSGNSPSVDRIIPELGYVSGNVRVISNKANVMKQDCIDPAIFRKLAEYVERHVDLCSCGAEHDRDTNAAQNIARKGLLALAEGASA